MVWTTYVVASVCVALLLLICFFFFFQAEDGIRDLVRSRGLGDVYKRQLQARGLARAEVRACTSSCLDVCWAGPIVAVEPDGYFYGRVTMADVPRIVDLSLIHI